MSRPTNGSSMMTSDAGRTSATASAAFWRMPRLNFDGQVAGPAREAERLDEFAARGLPVVDAMKRGDVLEVLPDAEVVVEHGIVGCVAELGAGRERAGLVAVDEHPTVARLDEAGDAAEQCRLARAVVPDERHEAAEAEPEVEVVHRAVPVVVLREVSDEEQRFRTFPMGHDRQTPRKAAYKRAPDRCRRERDRNDDRGGRAPAVLATATGPGPRWRAREGGLDAPTV